MKRYSLLPYNTFGLDVSATSFLEYASEDELCRLIGEGKVTRPFLHVGRGSNLLFVDDYHGTVLHSRIDGIEIVEECDDSVRVRVGAGVVWDDFVLHCVAHKWYGVENLSLIPGEVGASAVQNIGAYGVEVKDVIESVETINIEGVKRIYTKDECGYSYRNSCFKSAEMKSVFVTYVHFRLGKTARYTLDYGAVKEEVAKQPELSLENVRRVVVALRESKLPDPKRLGNAGSFFMNPIVPRSLCDELRKRYPSMPFYDVDAHRVKIPAGWLIEQAGWKGKALGPAAVYEKQALVLVNLGGASGRDIVKLSDAVRKSVHDQFGISITPEVNFIQ